MGISVTETSAAEINHDLLCAFIEVSAVYRFCYKPNLTVLKSYMMLSRSSIMVFFVLVEIYNNLFLHVLSLHKDLHTHSSVANYFKVTSWVSALGYENCFVFKVYYNIQTCLPFLVLNGTNSSWIWRYSLHVDFRFGMFSQPVSRELCYLAETIS